MEGILAILEPSISAGSKVAEYLAEPIKSQYNYLFHYKRNIGKLRNEAETLENMRAGVQLLVDEAKRNLEIIGRDVEAWLRAVDEIQKETELVLLTADKVEKRRWQNYSLSRKAVQKTKVIVELQRKSKFDHVSYNPPPPMVTAPTPLNRSEGFESRLSIMKSVMEALKEENIRLIGTCGMGGVGKTIMVKDIAAKVKKEGLFDEVVMAEVTQSPNLKSIQGSIAELLGLKLVEESLVGRAARLCEWLNGDKRVLVILDNIWRPLDLEELGIPPVAEDLRNGRCTIMLTSRNADVCEEMAVDRFFRVEPMPHEEAWVLFQKTADKLCHPHALWRDEFQGVAQDIVKECGGWPLAVVTIAKAIGSKRQRFMWDNALQSLRNSNFESDYKVMYSALQVSYESLESDELKQFFLLCCLFPQGYDILAEDLLRLGSGLRLFTYMDVFDMTRTRTKACIQKLKNLSLLLDSKDEECLRMHDVVHTFAMSVASSQEHLLVRHNDVTFRPRGDVEKISLWCEEMHALVARLEFTKLNLLLLVGSGSSDMLQFPQNFYEGMGQLKVLIHRGMKIQSLPLSFERLSVVQTLSLDYCNFGRECDLSIIGKLVNLEILSFAHSDVRTIPAELGNLARLRLLDMTGCVQLLDIASGVLHSLIKLEELYLRGTLFIWPEEQIKARLGELSSLPHLTTLEMELPSLKCVPEEMVYEKLTRFRICIGFAIESQAFQNTFKLLGGICSLNRRAIHMLFPRSEILHLVGHFGFTDPVYSLKSSAEEDLSKLRNLKLEHIHNLVYIVETSGMEATNDFAMLESLYLKGMSNLKEIWRIKDSWMFCAQQQTFGNLRDLYIWGCRSLKYVFSMSTAPAFVNLESVQIADCSELEELFCSKAEKVSFKIELPKLKSLKLQKLPHLACFCKEVDAVVLSKLVELELRMLPNFTFTVLTSSERECERNASSNRLFSKQKIDLGRETEISETPKKLTGVESHINPTTLYNTKSALSSQSIQSLHCLEVVYIESCDLVKVFFDLEALITEGENKAVVLNNLRVLDLLSLENMTHVWKHGFDIFEGFKNLTTLSLICCDKINYLFSTVIANFLVQLEKLVIRVCESMEEIVKEENWMEMAENARSKIIFPRLTSIQLYDLPRLRFLCSGSHVEFEWPLLASLEIAYCENMWTFTAGNSSTPSLKEIDLDSYKYSIQGDINSTLRSAQHKSRRG